MAEELEQIVEVKEKDFVNFIGKNADKYLPKFKKFNVDGVDKFACTWHWPAFFFSFFWMLYRKLYMWALFAFFWVLLPYQILPAAITCGMAANYIYYKRAKKKIIKYKTAKAPVDPHKAAISLRKKGGVKVWVPTLAVFTIFLTMILPHIHVHFYGYRAMHYNAVAQVELRNAAFAQNAYFEDNGTYADSVDKLVGPKYGLLLNEEVKVTVLRADENSYEMTSFHRRGKKRYTLVGPHGIARGKYRKWW
ncbi:MAG: DUF2628 domain-containing protein [Candidatus Hodarchaeota archaeon]